MPLFLQWASGAIQNTVLVTSLLTWSCMMADSWLDTSLLGWLPGMSASLVPPDQLWMGRERQLLL